MEFYCCLLSNGDLHIYIRLDADGGDGLDDLRGRVQVNDTLVDAHLEPVPGLGTFTTGGLPGGDAENLGGHADGSLHPQVVLVLGLMDKLATHLLKRLDVARGEGDADTVDGVLRHTPLEVTLVVPHCHFGIKSRSR